MKRVASLPDTAQLQRQDPFSKIRQLQTPSEGDRGIGVEAKRSPLPKLLLALMFPFVPVWVYALWHMFNAALLLLYMTLLLCYFVVLGAYIVAELSICPPWYQQSTPEKGLPMHDLPDYWQGIVHDPLQDFQLPFEEIEFRNADGMTLRGWWVPGLDPNPDLAVVFCHGGGRDRRAWLRHVPIFHRAGLPCLLFDLREHGISDGAMRGFHYGVREQYDVLAAVRYAVQRGPRHVVLCGTSVGGASVVYAATTDPSNVIGVICENPVAHPETFIGDHVRSVLGKWFWPVCRVFAELATYMFLWRIGLLWQRKTGAASHRIRSLTVPVFILHGTADEVVPLWHGQEMYDNAPPALRSLWIGEGAWHCALYDRFPDEFRERVHEFLRRCRTTASK